MKPTRFLAFIFVALLITTNLSLATPTPVEIFEKQSELDTNDLWPNFAPDEIPVALYDGEKTYLIRHPDPPEEFIPLDGHEGIFVSEGRHSSIVANTSTEINGILTSIGMTTIGSDKSVELFAATVVHESFHVFQKEFYGNWGVNEASTFTYPSTNAEIWELRKEILIALEHAVNSKRDLDAIGWAKYALELRDSRFNLMNEETRNYDRGMELLEGTARYVQFKSLNDLQENCFEDIEFLPTDARRPSYSVGCAFAVLLDRFMPDWKSEFTTENRPYLDDMLRTAIHDLDSDKKKLGKQELKKLQKSSEKEVALVVKDRENMLDEFLDKPGWTFILEPGKDNPLWPNGFDPMNVVCVDEVQVLHNRFVKLGNSLASIETMNHQALTFASGEHPIFTGVSKVVVTGLESEPLIVEDGDTKTVVTDKMKASFKDATIITQEQYKIVRIIF
jgi:hypothetical protein